MIRAGPLYAAWKLPAQLQSSLLLHPSRLYHSYQHERSPPFTPIEDSILSAALTHVPADGFTKTSLAHGARDAGYLDISTNLFPSGAFSIINYHIVTQRLALSQNPLSIPQNQDTSATDVTANIKTLILRRLYANKPIIHQWQDALALLSTVRHLPTSIRELALLSDEVLFLAGSTTVTSAWYTNRAAIATIYASTELVMTTDKSQDYKETEEFLTRRLEEAAGMRDVANGLGAWMGMQAGGLINGLRSKGVWI